MASNDNTSRSPGLGDSASTLYVRNSPQYASLDNNIVGVESCFSLSLSLSDDDELLYE